MDHTPIPRPTAAAEPPEEPPAVRCSFHGLVVGGYDGESVTPFHPNSGVVVLPSSTTPASRNLATAGESSPAGSASVSALPLRVGSPLINRMSLIVVGTPSAGPLGSPAAHRWADCLAASKAASGSVSTMARTR